MSKLTTAVKNTWDRHKGTIAVVGVLSTVALYKFATVAVQANTPLSAEFVRSQAFLAKKGLAEEYYGEPEESD